MPNDRNAVPRTEKDPEAKDFDFRIYFLEIPVFDMKLDSK